MKYLTKNIFLITLLLFGAITSFAQQSNNRNYILTHSYKQTGSDPNEVDKVDIQLQYFDGLGRPVQNIAVKSSPLGNDIVQPIGYDAFGRESKQYLPYTSNDNGQFQGSAISDAAIWYQNNIGQLDDSDLSRPFNETFFEPSPLGRPSGIRQAGNKSNTSSASYIFNGVNDVKFYKYNFTNSAIEQDGFYAAKTLNVVENTDEQGNLSRDYTDKRGRIVCRRVYATENEILSTYYVYDDLEMLRAVLQPKFQDNPSLSHFAFLYNYDGRGRVISKSIPGGGTTQMVYDKLDRLVLSQDSNQVNRGFWNFIKYDVLNRPVMTGEISSGNSRSQWQTIVNASTNLNEARSATSVGYSMTNSEPGNITESNILTVTYYDDYSFPGSHSYTNYFGYQTVSSAKSLVTGGRTRMLNTNREWLVNTVYYDEEYRTIQTIRDLYDLREGSFECHSIKYKYNLAPVISEEAIEQTILPPGTTSTMRTAGFVDNIDAGPPPPAYHRVNKLYQYDHADRLLSTKVNVSVPELFPTSRTTTALRYNELGQLKEKWYQSGDGVNFRHKTTFVNNIRGWNTESRTEFKNHYLDSHNENVFTSRLSYGNANYSNGNITGMLWKRGMSGDFKGLTFGYDDANRLLTSTGVNGYQETENMTYDKNGNILTLNRSGVATDQLVYTLSGNRTISIIDNSSNTSGFPTGGIKQFKFDANGNMTKDDSKEANITYNLLNLPRTVAIPGKTLTYDYDASGTKRKYSSTEGPDKSIRYEGIFEYNEYRIPQRIAIPDGQILLRGNIAEYNYYLTDHLGNVRGVFNQNGGEMQSTDYYPFGLEVPRTVGTNKYTFLGREKQPETGYMDLMKRFYDPTAGRFVQVDPITDTQENYSTYQYGWNNPILRSDPNGDFPDCCSGFGDFLTGLGNALTENIAGAAPIRATPGYKDAYNDGRTLGHAVSAVGGAFVTAKGLIDIGSSGTALVVSGGAAAPIAIPGIAVGVGEVAVGINTMSNAIDNLRNDKGRVNADGNSGGEAKQRNKPKESGTPNSSEIQSRDKSGKIDKYSTYDQNGKIVKEYRGSGKDHGNIPRPNVKEPKYNLNPKTGEKFQNGYEVRKAKSDEIPK